MRLAKAHITLAQAEFGEIANEIKRLAIGVGIAFVLLLFVGMLMPVGTTLFVGEWLFGSIGWGVLHGAELAIALAVAAVLGVLGATRGQIVGSFLLAVLVAVIVGVVLGLDLTNQGWTRFGDEVMNRFEPGVRPLVTAVVIVGGVIAVVGLLAGLVSGGIGGAIGGLIGGAILGALIGAFTAIAWGPRPGAAAGVALGLIVWPAALGILVMRRGLDLQAIKNRLIPKETIETTRETIEWVRTQTPLGRKS